MKKRGSIRDSYYEKRGSITESNKVIFKIKLFSSN